MPVRSRRVTIRDLEGTDHSVQVTASTLYEAVALGLRRCAGRMARGRRRGAECGAGGGDQCSGGASGGDEGFSRVARAAGAFAAGRDAARPGARDFGAEHAESDVIPAIW